MNYYQKILQKCFERNIPFFPYMELTRRCNLNCVHCYVLKDEIKKEEELTYSEIKLVLTSLKKMGALFLTFTGGEIFLREDILDIVMLASKEKFAIHLMTNGTLLDETMLQKLKKSNLIGIDITLFSMKSSIHDAIVKVCGAHSKTINAIECCKKFKIPITIKMPIMKQNVSEFEAVLNFAKECHAQFVFDLILIPTDDGKNRMQEFGLQEKEIMNFLNVYHYGEKTKVNTMQDASQLEEDANEPLCGAGFSTLCIAPDGTVLPCPGLRIGVGNIRNEPLEKIWSSSKLDFIRKARYANCKDCISCSFKRYCARCPGAAFAEQGSIYAPFTASCTLAKVVRYMENKNSYE